MLASTSSGVGIIPPTRRQSEAGGGRRPASAAAVPAWAALRALLSNLMLRLAEGSLARREKQRLRRHPPLHTGNGGANEQTKNRLRLLP